MKKSLTILLIIAFLLAGLFLLTGCGDEKKEDTNPTATVAPTATSAPTATPAKTTTNADTTASEKEYEMKVTKNGNTLMVTIDAEGLVYDRAPWVGIVPVGEYKDEAEADEYDVTYTYVDAENYPNIELNVDGIEEGEWLVILCDTDDDGEILATAPVVL